MKRILSIIVLAAGVTPSLPAQGIDLRLKADIPFAFYVGDHRMPAGEYWIRSSLLTTTPMVVEVKSTGPGGGAFLIPLPAVYAAEAPMIFSLVFRKYGDDRYFLGEVWRAGLTDGTEFPKSKKEREAVTSTLITGARPTSARIVALSIR